MQKKLIFFLALAEHLVPPLTLALVSLRCAGAAGPRPWSPASPGSSGRRWSPPRTPRRATRSSSSSRCPGSSSRRPGRRWSPRTCPASGRPWRSPRWAPHPADCLQKRMSKEKSFKPCQQRRCCVVVFFFFFFLNVSAVMKYECSRQFDVKYT